MLFKGRIGKSNIKRLGTIVEYSDVLVRPLRADVATYRDIGEYGLTRLSGIMARRPQAHVNGSVHRDVLQKGTAYWLPGGAVS